MTAAAKLTQLNSWDISDADISLWGFRKVTKDGRPQYKSKWINIDASLNSSLGALFVTYQQGFRECLEYDLLTEAADTQYLSIPEDQTHASILIESTDVRREEYQAGSAEDLENLTGYLLKVKKGTNTAFAVKRTESSWKSRNSGKFLNAMFKHGELKLVDDRSFRLENKFDFIVFNDHIFIDNRKAFESLLDYRTDFQTSFSDLVRDHEFNENFAATNEIESFVGSNMLQLRRLHAVRQKAHYRDPNFTQKVRQVCLNRNWPIQFDAQGKIIPTAATVQLIITILLDHRLVSEFTSNIYDVQSSTRV